MPLCTHMPWLKPDPSLCALIYTYTQLQKWQNGYQLLGRSEFFSYSLFHTVSPLGDPDSAAEEMPFKSSGPNPAPAPTAGREASLLADARTHALTCLLTPLPAAVAAVPAPAAVAPAAEASLGTKRPYVAAASAPAGPAVPAQGWVGPLQSRKRPHASAPEGKHMT